MGILKDTSITFSSQIIYVILCIAASIIVARELEPSGKGIYSILTLIPMIIIALGNLGISSANTYLGGKKAYGWSEIASNSLILSILLGAISIVVSGLYFFIVNPGFINGIDITLIDMVLLSIPFSLLSQYFSYILLGQKKILNFNLINIITAMSSMIFLLVFMTVLKTGLLGAIAAYLISTIFASVASILYVRRTSKIRLAFSYGLFKDSIKFGLQSYMANVVQLLNYRLDLLLVAVFMTSTFIGYYSTSTLLAEALWYFPGAIGTIIFSRTPGLTSEELNRQTPKICRNTLFITILSSLALILTGNLIITLLYGPLFLPAYEPMLILLPGCVALSVCKVLSNELLGRGMPRVNLAISVVALIISIPLLVVLIPLWGVNGAALASTIDYLTSAILVIFIFNKITKTRLVDLILINRDDLKIYLGIMQNIRKYVFKRMETVYLIK